MWYVIDMQASEISKILGSGLEIEMDTCIMPDSRAVDWNRLDGASAHLICPTESIIRHTKAIVSTSWTNGVIVDRWEPIERSAPQL
jgi:hypothetical protein